ncbi:MAG: hypothetical protein ACREC0_13875 [Methylocella sp.]
MHLRFPELTAERRLFDEVARFAAAIPVTASKLFAHARIVEADPVAAKRMRGAERHMQTAALRRSGKLNNFGFSKEKKSNG